MSDAPRNIWYGRTMPTIYTEIEQIPDWEEKATHYIRFDLYQSQVERIAELERALKIVEQEAGVNVKILPEGIRWSRRLTDEDEPQTGGKDEN